MWRIAAVCTAFLGALTPIAAAAERTGQAATVVTAGTLSVAAQPTAEGGVCLDVTRDGATTADALCPRPSALGLRTLRLADATVFFGATTAATRRVDLTLGRRTLRLPTRAASGFAGRFYAIAVDGAPAVGAITARGRHGRVRAARDLDPLALPRLGARWVAGTVADELERPSEVVVSATRLLVSKHGRRRPALCAGLRTEGVTGRAVCARKATRLEFRFAASCDTGRELLYGLAPAFVRSASAVLEDGSRRAVDVHRVPRKVRRAGSVLVAQVPNGRVKTVLVYDRRGTRVGSAKLSGGAC
jgi:hypothetical protein